MTGAEGKCPLKKGSLMVTFLSATIRRFRIDLDDAVHEEKRGTGAEGSA